ncbi:DUF3363 domain-containing protein [Sphingopyxis sp.]|uniref:DUF3363 domain-containing protein n=1 Tax=Sphingopyxis sp. TaxID=1908224 RepID=UPI0025FC30EC|nr:DUF3363 domain-containing protein [Sphingopyxis sp.]
MEERTRYLVEQGLASRAGDRLTLSSGLIDKLASRDLEAATASIAERTGLAHKPSAAGDYVSGIYRKRVTLASGRFAMIDDGLGFQLVPWRPALDRHLGQHITGTMSPAARSIGRWVGASAFRKASCDERQDPLGPDRGRRFDRDLRGLGSDAVDRGRARISAGARRALVPSW